MFYSRKFMIPSRQLTDHHMASNWFSWPIIEEPTFPGNCVPPPIYGDVVAVDRGLQEVGYVERTTNFVIGTAPQEILALPSIAFDGIEASIVEFYAPVLQLAPKCSVLIMAYIDGVESGQISGSTTNNEDASTPVYRKRRFIPPSGSHILSIWASGSGVGVTSGGAVIIGGPGGAGQYFPMWLSCSVYP